jgi:FkbM family methyltransferase
MNFSAISRKSLLGRLLRALLSLVPPSMHVPILQGRLRGRRWIVGSSNHGCWLGSYEFEKQSHIGFHLSPNDTFYDVGAHVGFYTILAAQIVGPTGHICAFEPLPHNLSFLRQHVKLNNFANISIYGAAVGSREGTAHFKIEDSTSMGHLDENGEILIRLVSLDSLVERGEIPVANMIKIDVEGAEYEVLQGAKKLLTEYPIKIFLATHSNALNEQCTTFLKALGYNAQSLNQNIQGETDEWLFCK